MVGADIVLTLVCRYGAEMVGVKTVLSLFIFLTHAYILYHMVLLFAGVFFVCVGVGAVHHIFGEAGCVLIVFLFS